MKINLFKTTLLFFICFFGFSKAQTTPIFTVTNLSSSYSITCNNSSVNLIATSNYSVALTYTWTNGSAVLSGSNITINSTGLGVYTVTAYASSSVSSLTFTIGVNLSIPSSTLTPLLQNITCSITSITSASAMISPTVNTSHLWVSPQGGSLTVNSGSLSTYLPGGTGTYTHVAINNSSGCKTIKTFTLTSSWGFPTFSLSSANNFSFACLGVGTASILNASTFPTPGGPLSYTLLSPGSSTVLPGGTLGTSTAYTTASAGTWTFVVRDNTNQCVTRSAFSVAQHTAGPVLSITATNPTLCNGTSVTLNALGANTYTFTGGITNGVSFVPSVSNTYTVTGTNTLTGCSNTVGTTINIVVNPLPVVSAVTSNSNICIGSSITLNGNGANTYTWTGGVTNGQSYTPASTTSFSVSGTNTLTGCTSTNNANITITVNQGPTISIAATQSAVCIGNTVTLTASGANTYTWSGGVVNGLGFIPSGSATYTVTGSSTLTGCSNTVGASISVIVNPLPIVSGSASSNLICLGNSVTLNGTGALFYNWSGGVLNNTPFAPNTTTTYLAAGTDANGCVGYASQPITVSVLPLPILSVTSSEPIYCSGMTTTLVASGAITYTWPGGSNGSSFVVNPINPTNYIVTGTDANNCSNNTIYSLVTNTQTAFSYTTSGLTATFSISNPGGCSPFLWDFGNNTTSTLNYNPVITFSVAGIYGVCLKCEGLPSACVKCMNIKVPAFSIGGVGIAEIESVEQSILYPNPNNGEFIIETAKISSVSIFNSMGQVIKEERLHEGKNRINLNEVAKGIYFIEINDGSKKYTQKLIVQ